jgi:hypothetical protein
MMATATDRLKDPAFSETVMTSTRRQFACMLGAAASAAGLFKARLGLAQDDDDLPGNVFISPPGQPFRAPLGAPYPVVDWFKQANKKGDGKLDHAEFLADAEGFFNFLDLRRAGVLDGYDIEVYERRVAPEILGYRVDVSALEPGRGRPFGGARLWLAQENMPGEPSAPPEGATGPPATLPEGGHKLPLDESDQGASPYGFFDAPEPVTAADPDFRGFILKANFLALASRHFTELDRDNEGFLSLAKLPKTKVEMELEHYRPKRR